MNRRGGGIPRRDGISAYLCSRDITQQKVEQLHKCVELTASVAQEAGQRAAEHADFLHGVARTAEPMAAVCDGVSELLDAYMLLIEALEAREKAEAAQRAPTGRLDLDREAASQRSCQNLNTAIHTLPRNMSPDAGPALPL